MLDSSLVALIVGIAVPVALVAGTLIGLGVRLGWVMQGIVEASAAAKIDPAAFVRRLANKDEATAHKFQVVAHGLVAADCFYRLQGLGNIERRKAACLELRASLFAAAELADVDLLTVLEMPGDEP